MKLEWGKKVCCPSCSSPFYDLRKTALLCPSCGHSFSASDLNSRRSRHITIDDVGTDDEKIDVLSGFGFDACDNDDVDIIDDVRIRKAEELGEIDKMDDADL
jgi:uncharacterized protein (TIGR02300 family)